MKLHQTVAVLLIFPAALLLQGKSKKPAVPEVFAQAKSIYVEAVDGQEFDQNVNAADRIAIADVRDALSKWKRYALVTSRSDADIVIVLQKGRAENGDGEVTPRRGQLPGGAGQPGGIGPDEQIGAGPDLHEDLFEVCRVKGNGGLSAPLWQESMPNGLNGPKVILLEQFEEAVDKAYPPAATSAAKSQKP